MIRVWIVAPSSLARGGLENLLASRRISVAGTSADLDSFGGQILDNELDAIVVDGSGDNAHALLDALIESDLAAEAPVVVLLDHPRPDWTPAALRSGVRAVLPSDVSANQLAAALQGVGAGLLVLHPSQAVAAMPAVSAFPAPPAELAEPLTPREREVLQRLASGLVNKQIADQLRISEHTVKFHVASILGKLGAATRTEAVSLGIRHGLVLL
ncbi:MAG TPA: response regulator transcription factor [Candidatus Methylomirabilis sp.]|nr:response regulator transcription factor [Candidatus Methylomirabilis sp.]